MRILAIGAHPDDCELQFAGTAARLTAEGHAVKFLSVTNGESGHAKYDPQRIAEIRKQESQEARRRLGIAESEVLNNPDGRLVPAIDTRDEILRRIRLWKADLVLTHRPWDYHPDHRYTSQMVQDSAYLVMVPHICPDAPALRTNPVFLYFEDKFQLPSPFLPDIAVDISSVWEEKMRALGAHASQFYEWLPWIGGFEREVPADLEERRTWLSRRYGREPGVCIQAALARRYGAGGAGLIRHAEAFQVCEYGRRPSEEELDVMFPR